MDVTDAIRQRYSVRSYQGKEVEEEKLTAVLEAARLAPSANNRQEWRFVVVREAATRKRLVEAAKNQGFVGQAPVVIAACATESKAVMACGHPTYAVDLAIAVSYMTLAAVEQGLGTCWLGAFEEDKVQQVLGIPAEIRVPALLTLGYPADAPRAKRRKALEEIVSFEAYAT